MKFTGTLATTTTTNWSVRLALMTVLALSCSAEAQTYKVLHSFTNGSDGAAPIAGVTIDCEGNLYGTTSAGGRRGFGDRVPV